MKTTLLIALAFLSMYVAAQPSYPTDPMEGKVIFSDLDNFLEGYTSLTKDSDTIAILKQYYFSRASDGLTEYISRHGLTPENLAKAIGENPDTYSNLVSFKVNIDRFINLYGKELIRFENVISDAMYPPAYLLIGANKGIAQASPKGQLITIERATDAPEKLLHVMIHELTHFQQARTLGFQNYIKTYSTPNNMLDLILREGGAEFISYYLVEEGKRPYRNKDFFESNEASLKSRFITDLQNQDATYWMWDSLNDGSKNTLLGYTMGYKICVSYYQNAENKEQALHDILGISDAKQFLQASNYFVN